MYTRTRSFNWSGVFPCVRVLMKFARRCRLALMYSMWLSHVSLESNMIPRNLKLFISVMRLLFRIRLRSRYFFFFLENVTAMPFGTENVSFHCFAHSSIFLRYFCRLLSVSHLVVAVEWISISSENSDISHPSSGFGKSVIMLNNSGLSTHPWGTPLLSFLSGDILLSTRTMFLLL